MALSKHFIDQFVNVTSRAALASSYLVGKKDKIAADKAAVDAMRLELNKINFKGKIVIGEGELDEAPQFMSTHPSSDTRIKQLNEWMNEVILDYPPIKIT